MSYIVRSGNLAGPPRLEHTQEGIRASVSVIVDDSVYKDGKWVTTATTAYRLYLKGAACLHLAHTQEASGNIPVIFSGTLKVRTYTNQTGQERISNDVYVDHIGPDLTRNPYTVLPTPKTKSEDAHTHAGQDAHAACQEVWPLITPPGHTPPPGHTAVS